MEVVVTIQIDLLAKIQEMDLALDQLRRQILKGPKQIAEKTLRIKILEDEIAAEKQKIEQTRKMQRQYEMEVEENSDRIRKSKTRLLGIKNNKEYHAVLSEIETIESANLEKEENILVCMEETERLRGLYREKEDNCACLRGVVEKEIEGIQQEMDRAQQRLLVEEQTRESIAKKIDPNILQKYERLKISRGGLAVAQVENATCSGCNMNIPPQMYNELQRRNSLGFCPNCERIVYWQQVDEKTE